MLKQFHFELLQVLDFKFSFYSCHSIFILRIIPVKHSDPARQTRSQARAQAVLTSTLRAPLDGTPGVPQLKAHLDSEPNLEGAAPSRKEGKGPSRSSSFSGVVGSFPGLSSTNFKGPGYDDEEEEEISVEEEEHYGTEGVPAPMGASQGAGGPNLAQSTQPVSHQSEPSLLVIMQQMTPIMGNPQEASTSEASRLPAFKTPSMKAPECFDGTQTFKVISFIQSCELIFHNHLSNFSHDRKKALYATSFLIGRAAKWIEPYSPNLTNQDPNYLLNSWTLFESKLFNLSGDPNEVRKAEAELDSSIIKEGVYVSLYISYSESLVSRIEYQSERTLIHHFRRGSASRILDQFSSHLSRIDSLQGLMDITLELYTRCHQRKREKGPFQEKKPEALKSCSSHPQNSSSSN
ncbi:hypothetical protein O181_026038 [Austropuccinia psidii MF-1]|uniref:DUF4939 domain-containing protein n=1 Tax=Austropuccinia psidii MF-1 TaxID=1389203 RepID=A0A9Q3GZN3_9BASI|nr:hypothetical protein [Austropuccinia psidii MF-1]